MYRSDQYDTINAKEYLPGLIEGIRSSFAKPFTIVTTIAPAVLNIFEQPAGTMRNKITVLIVEDEPLIRMNIADELHESGFEVVEPGNAAEAILALEQNALIRLMFTDVGMPGMDGLELAATVRDGWPPVQIIVTSVHREVRIGDMPAHSRFFNKPYSPCAIAASMREMVP